MMIFALLHTELSVPPAEFLSVYAWPSRVPEEWYNCKAQRAEFITDFLQWAQSSEQKRAPTFIQTPLKEQWAASKTTESLSLQTACYVILEFSKYYVSEQLRIPRSFIYFFQRYRTFSLSLCCLWLLFVQSGRVLPTDTAEDTWYSPGFPLYCQYGFSSNTCNIFLCILTQLKP